MYYIRRIDKISPKGLDRFDTNEFKVSPDVADPDGVLVRSGDLHSLQINPSLKAIARAGTGTNNVPVGRCTEAGIVVFNSPGANANSVRELVLASLVFSSRDIIEGVTWVRSLTSNVESKIEEKKSQFTGPEIRGKRIAVIGLGAIGVQVANGAAALGMDVTGYDPFISVESAWGLSRDVRRAAQIEPLISAADFVTLHLPLTDRTTGFFDAEKFRRLKPGVRLLNFARGGLVEIKALLEAIASGVVARYVTDFPDDALVGNRSVIPVPHLGASTPEAEDNCAIMAADQTIEYLTAGNIRNSINFPDCELTMTGTKRIVIANRNIPNMVSQITAVLANKEINISDMLNRHLGDHAYNIIDVDGPIPDATIGALQSIEGVLMARLIDNGAGGT